MGKYIETGRQRGSRDTKGILVREVMVPRLPAVVVCWAWSKPRSTRFRSPVLMEIRLGHGIPRYKYKVTSDAV